MVQTDGLAEPLLGAVDSHQQDHRPLLQGVLLHIGPAVLGRLLQVAPLKSVPPHVQQAFEIPVQE